MSASGDSRRYVARGLSMLPGIYPRDWLVVEEVHADHVSVGDLIAHVGAGHIVCHRVVSIETRADGRWYGLRGDAQVATEWVPEEALVFSVTEVDGRLGHWRPDGTRGRLLRHLALSQKGAWRSLRLVLVRALREYARLRRGLGSH